MTFPEAEYCGVHHLLARGSIDTLWDPAELSMIGRSIYLEGSYLAPDAGAPVAFVIDGDGANAVLEPFADVLLTELADTGAGSRIEVRIDRAACLPRGREMRLSCPPRRSSPMNPLSRMAVFSTLLAASCASSAIHVRAADPRPQITVPASERSVVLRLDDAIRDGFRVPGRSGVPEARVEDWRRTLTRGFQHGFGAHAAAAGTSGAASWTLELRSATLAFVRPDEVDSHSGHHTAGWRRWRADDPPPRVVPVHGEPHVVKTPRAPKIEVFAQVAYEARLLAAGGEVVGRSARTVVSLHATGRGSEGAASASSVVAEAVAAMYEAMARDFFTVAANPR